MPHIKRKSKETIDKRLVMAITIIRQGVWKVLRLSICVGVSVDVKKNKGNPKVSLI